MSGANGRLHNLIDPAEYTLYLRQNLPGRVLQQLNREFEIISAKAKERLVEIAQAETLETLKSYISQKSSSPQAVQNLATWPVSDGDIFDLDSSPFFETDFVMDQLWATGKERTS